MSCGFCRAWIAGVGLGDTRADGGAAVLRWCCCRFWEPKSQSSGRLCFFLFKGRGRLGEEDGDSGVLGKGLLFVRAMVVCRGVGERGR
jgi:hypothetical protein